MSIFSHLDVTTLIIIVVTVEALCFISQLLILRWNPDIPGIPQLALGHLLVCLGTFILLTRIYGHYLFSVLGGNGLVTIGFYLFFCGLAINVGHRPKRHWIFLSMFSLYMTLMFYFSAFHDLISVRTVLCSLALASLFFSSVVALWPRLKERNPIYCLIALILAGQGIFFIYRVCHILINLSNLTPLFKGGSLIIATLLEGLCFLYTINMACMVMISITLQERLRQQARVDHLTGLYNRMAFDDLSRQIFSRAGTGGTQVAVLMLDLDHFKTVNDTNGHAMGDCVLSRFAQTVSAALRPTDLMGRFGGEEFVVLLPDSDRKTAQEVSERLRILTEELTFPCSGNSLKVTVSIGVAVGTPADGDDFDTLFQQADAALYRAKGLGRNRVEPATKATAPERAIPVPQV